MEVLQGNSAVVDEKLGVRCSVDGGHSDALPVVASSVVIAESSGAARAEGMRRIRLPSLVINPMGVGSPSDSSV